MTTNFDVRVKNIDRSVLDGVVAEALGGISVQVVDYRYEVIHGGMGGYGSGIAGVARFSGMARSGGEGLAWSAIAKVLPLPAGGSDEFEGTRELYAYRSGVLDSLPGGVVAPRCLGIVEEPGETAVIWMEDVREESGMRWPLDHFGFAAYHLGLFN